MKFGDKVEVINHRWHGKPNVTVGSIGEIIGIHRGILPIQVAFDIGNPDDEEEVIANFEREDLKLVEPTTAKPGEEQ